MFVGRTEELNIINRVLLKPSGCIMVYGKRKVGKTTLIKEALKQSKYETIYFECIKSTLGDNLSSFVGELVRCKILPSKILFESFIDLFAYLNSLNKTLNIVIDEYPYLKAMNKAETVDSIFQNIIDNRISNIRLFLSGSHISMMKDLLEENNALYGRFDYVIKLNELNYKEISEFYKEKSVYDKIAFYSIFGGSPYVNRYIDSSKTLEENIEDVILDSSSPIHQYLEYLLLSDYKNVGNVERILYSISNGKKKYNEIEAMLEMRNNGLLAKQLEVLMDMGLVSKIYPINKLSDNKKAYYEINDNLLRFYFTFMYKSKSALEILGSKTFYKEYIEEKIKAFVSYRFEDVVKNYFALSVKKGTIDGVTNIGKYYYDDPINKKNGEFDVVIQRKDTYDLYEVKYYSHSLSISEMNREKYQIGQIPNLKIGKIGFVCTGGYEEENKEFDCIDIQKLYE